MERRLYSEKYMRRSMEHLYSEVWQDIIGQTF